jgi:hypothetical protein
LNNQGLLEDFHLVLHGTAQAPHHMQGGPRMYNEDYNSVQNERSVSGTILREKTIFRILS